MKYIIIVFTVCLFLNACTDSNSENKKQVNTKKVIAAYQLTTIEKGGVATVIKLPAQLAAYLEVSIFPKVNAYVKTVSVDIGSRVTKGAVLMELEAPELVQAVAQAKEKFAKSQADFALDKERYSRLLEASTTAGAISPLDLSTIRSKMQADSAVSNAEKTNWQMQQTMLGYLKVTAPFAGVITDRNVNPGALVSASSKDKPMLELKQIARLRLQVDIPEALASTLNNQDTVSFYVSALQGKKLTGLITRKSMDINEKYRSERIEIDVPNKEEQLSSGMYADVVLYSKGNIDALYVPRSAVVTSTERKYVLVVRNGRIIKSDVTTGNATTDKIEVFGAINKGDKIIADANDEIKEGPLP
jgi:membrane fusion protein (multidrug efflux system)